MQFVSVGLWIDGERGVTSKHFFSTEVLHVDQQLELFPQSQMEEILKAWKHTNMKSRQSLMFVFMNSFMKSHDC